MCLLHDGRVISVVSRTRWVPENSGGGGGVESQRYLNGLGASLRSRRLCERVLPSRFTTRVGTYRFARIARVKYIICEIYIFNIRADGFSGHKRFRYHKLIINMRLKTVEMCVKKKVESML